jgi:hypothetical protein
VYGHTSTPVHYEQTFRMLCAALAQDRQVHRPQPNLGHHPRRAKIVGARPPGLSGIEERFGPGLRVLTSGVVIPRSLAPRRETHRYHMVSQSTLLTAWIRRGRATTQTPHAAHGKFQAHVRHGQHPAPTATTTRPPTHLPKPSRVSNPTAMIIASFNQVTECPVGLTDTPRSYATELFRTRDRLRH